MKQKLVWPIFWALTGIFVLVASVIFTPAARELVTGFWFITIAGVAFFSLGATLLFLTVKGKARGMLKKFLILTGASSMGLVVSASLHNASYGPFIHRFGTDFWDRVGGVGEPLFSVIMAIFICLVAFLVGTVGSRVLAIKQFNAKGQVRTKAKKAKKARGGKGRVGKKAEEVYEGDVQLVIRSPIHSGQLRQFQECLERVENIRIAWFGWSEGKGSVIAISVQKPTPLIKVLSKVDMVEDVTKKAKNIVIILKSATDS